MLTSTPQECSMSILKKDKTFFFFVNACSILLPGVTVNQFGSSVNGFGLKGCDMDVYLGLDNIGMSVRSTVSIIWLISNLQCMCLQKEKHIFSCMSSGHSTHFKVGGGNPKVEGQEFI